MSTIQPNFRVATYNIHKGVRGIGPQRRLEIHNLSHAVEQFDADLICLQEVRKLHRRETRHFTRWPELGQADFLAPEGYQAVYRSNAITRHGEHGNALLTRWPVIAQQHQDMSDHRFEQRGLLHVEVLARGQPLHVVVIHLGLLPASRRRQLDQLASFIRDQVPPAAKLVVAGDFNDWGTGSVTVLADLGMRSPEAGRHRTFPSRLPLVQLDHVYARGLKNLRSFVPRGRVWWRMSDHLPLIADFSFGEG